jgi:DUF4097 and DUF4098 domain-containing protein YvlB
MSRSVLTFFGLTVLTISTAFAQMQDNREKQLGCDDRNNNGFGDRSVRKCEVREQTLASVRQLTVEPGRNGGVSVKGWTQGDVLVRARMEAWAASDSEASLLLSQVHSDASAGRVAASGPESSGRASWSVSYEIFVPQASDLKVTALNGPISVRDLTGRMELNTKNGPLDLKRVAGDIIGKTTNGPVKLEPLGGSGWQGRQLELETKNGPVNIAIPSDLSAHIQAQAVRGPIQSDLGGFVDGNRRSGRVDLNLGVGGASFKVTTTNGPIRLARI